MKRRVFLAQAMLLGSSACSLGHQPQAELAHYDLGIDPPPATRARLQRSLSLDEVSAGAWLQKPALLYRLAYRDPARLQAYSLSRWIAPPAMLVTQRLRVALSVAVERGVTMSADGQPTERLLKVELDAFEQVVQAPNSSHALVRTRASLMNAGDRRLRAQRSFGVEEVCPSVDAEGAVIALRRATDTLLAEMLEWLAAVSDDAPAG